MLDELKVLLQTRIREGKGDIALYVEDAGVEGYRKALRAAGAGEGYFLKLEGAVLEEGNRTLCLSAGRACLSRMDREEEARCPYNGMRLEFLCAWESDTGEYRFSIRFYGGEEKDVRISALFPSFPPMRGIDGGVMVRIPSPAGDIRLEGMEYIYDTVFADLARESPEEDYPQPLYLKGAMKLEGGRLLEDYPFLPEVLALSETGGCPDSMLRFFERDSPAFRLYGTTEGVLFDFGDIRVSCRGFGVFVTNAAEDAYAVPGEEGEVSQILLYLDAVLRSSTQDIPLYLYSDLYQNAGYWNFKALFEDGVGISQGLGFLFDVFQIPVNREDVPGDVWLLKDLKLREIRLSLFRPKEKDLCGEGAAGIGRLRLASVSFLVCSYEKWVTPLPLLSFDNVGIFLELVKKADGFSCHGNLFADFVLAGRGGGKETAFRTVLSMPDLSVRAWLLTEVKLPLAEALTDFLGARLPGIPDNLVVSNAGFHGDWREKSLDVELAVEGDWGFSVGNNRFSMQRLEAAAQLSPEGLRAGVKGYVSLACGAGVPAVLFLEAWYDGRVKAWEFGGGLSKGAIELVDFAANFFGTPPEWLRAYAPGITIRDLLFLYSTAPGNPMSVKGSLEVAVPLSFFGTSFQVRLKAQVQRQLSLDERGQVLTGSVGGALSVGRFTMEAEADFREKGVSPSYTFRILIGDAFVAAALIRDRGKEVLEISLGNMTVGDVIAFFGKLVNPNYDFRLEAPWDVLASIPLSGTKLTYDILEKAVIFTYSLNKDLGIARVGDLGFRYDWGKGRNGFDIILTGSFMGKEYTPERPLSWDVMNDAPPVQGASGRFELSFLALGQHIGYDGYMQDRVGAALLSMERAMKPVDPGEPDPFGSGLIRFDGRSGLLLGLEARIAGFINLKVVLRHPDLYGGLLTLTGGGAGSLNGLSLEMLYTSSNGIGLFQIVFQVPQRFRRLQLGALTIQMGIIRVQIDTAGGFLVDLGFPHNMDFRQSFGLELFPFKGSGGAYFGILHGNAWGKLPETNKGVFDPVIAFGLGLDIGIGKSFDAGILSASVSASVYAVLEGVLAWFHPYKNSATSLYYYVNGTAGVRGSLWGKVDFWVVAVTVGVNITASVCLVLQSAEPTFLTLTVNVEAYASIRILFIKIHFSFHVNVSVDFTIGKRENAPWKAVSSGHGEGLLFYSARQRAAMLLSHQKRTEGFLKTAGMGRRDGIKRYVSASDYEKALCSPTLCKAAADGKEAEIAIWIMPDFTLADIEVDIGMPREEESAYRICFLPVLADEDGKKSALSILVGAFLELNMDAAGLGVLPREAEGGNRTDEDAGNGIVTWDGLKHLETLLSDIEACYGYFTVEYIGRVLEGKRIKFRVGYPGKKETAAGTAFPMPPVLTGTFTLQDGKTEERDYSVYGAADEEYVAWLRKLYGSFYDRERVREGREGGSSMAEHTFRGYFYMLSRVTVQKAVEALEQSRHRYQGGSLVELCACYPKVEAVYLYRREDGPEEIAEAFGLGIRELLFLNPDLAEAMAAWEPGKIYPILLGLTPQGILRKNRDWELKEGFTLFPERFPNIVWHKDTIRSAVEKVEGNLEETVEANLDAEGLLDEAEGFTLAQVEVGLPHSMLLDLWAAVFYVRLYHPSLGKAQWYYEAICSMNTDMDGGYLWIPASYGSTQEENRVRWKQLPGDSPRLVSSYCALYQEPSSCEAFGPFLAQVRMANQGGDGRVFCLPAQPAVRVLAGETLRSLGKRLFMAREGETARLTAMLVDIPFLKPTAVLSIARARLVTGKETVEGFCGRWHVSLEDLADLLKEEDVLVKREVLLPVLYGLERERLLAGLCTDENLEEVSGMLSRFLLNGQVVPERFDQGKPVHPMGLYEKSGQQFVSPSPAQGIACRFGLRQSRAVPWLELEGGEIQIGITAQEMDENFPATVLCRHYLERGPVDVVETYLPEYSFAQFLIWEELCEGEACSHTIAMFPEEFGLKGMEARLWKRMPEETVVSGEVRCCWGALVKLSAHPYGDVCAVSPAGEDGVRMLRTIEESGIDMKLKLLYAAGRGDGRLVSGLPVREKTILVRTGLSHVPAPPVCVGIGEESAGGEEEPSWAAMAEEKEFLRLLARCGAGEEGYWLRYCEEGEPLHVGEEGGVLYLLLCPKEESLRVEGFCNCAITKDYIDAGSEILLAVEEAGSQSARNRYPVEAGTAGICLLAEKPAEEGNGGEEEKQLMVRRAYSLASFHITEEPFSSIDSYLPMMPQCMGEERVFRGKAYAGRDVWHYRLRLDLADAAGLEKEPKEAEGERKQSLPDAGADPYRHIARAFSLGRPSPYRLEVQVVWHDILGNRSKPEPAIPLEYGYSDELMAVTSYEATQASYRIVPAGGGGKAAFAVDLLFSATLFMPDAGEIISPEKIKEAAGNVEKAYYQAAQGDVALFLENTLCAPRKLPVEKLAGYLGDAWRFLKLMEHAAQTTAGGETFAGLCLAYGISLEGLADGNAGRTIRELFDGRFPYFPDMKKFREGDCLEDFFPEGPALCWYGYNGMPALRPGICLQMGESRKVSYEGKGDAASLVQIAAALRLPVEELARANCRETGIFAREWEVTYHGFRVTAAEEDSFQNIADKFALAGIRAEAAELAAETAMEPVWKSSLVLWSALFAAEEGMSLCEAADRLGMEVSALAEKNKKVRGLYPADTMLLVGECTVYAGKLDLMELTLDDVCSLIRCRPYDILFLNRDMQAGTVSLPGHVRLEPCREYEEGWYYTESASLAQEARRVGTDAVTLALANRGVAGILKEGVGLTVTKEGISRSILTKSNYSLSVLPLLFAAQGMEAGLEEIIEGNKEAEVLINGVMLLKPPLCHMEAAFGREEITWPGGTFPLWAGLTLQRADCCMHSRTLGTTAQTATGILPPACVEGTLEEFAGAVREALPGLYICQKGGDGGQIWGFLLDEGHVGKFRIQPYRLEAGEETLDAPFFFAIRPLAKEMMSRGGISLPVVREDGTLSYEITRIFENIDMECWAAEFLEDMEWIGMPENLGRLCGTCPEALNRLAAIKRSLARAISAGADLCLRPLAPLPDEEERRAAAGKQFEELLLHSLVSGYTGSAVIQYEVESWQKEASRHILKGSACLKEGNTEEAGLQVYGDGIAIVPGAPLSPKKYQHFYVEAGNRFRQPALDLEKLAWKTSEIEANVEVHEGLYQKADILRPILPVEDERLTIRLASQAPMPLFARNVPGIPELLHSTQEVRKRAEEVLAWHSAYMIRLPVLAQDTVFLELSCNAAPEGKKEAEEEKDLFTAFACFREAAGELKKRIAETTEEATYRNLLSSWYGLAEDTATAWEMHWQGQKQTRETGSRQVVSFIQQISYEGEKWTLRLQKKDTFGKDCIGYPSVSCGEDENIQTVLIRSLHDTYAEYRLPEGTGRAAENVEELVFSYDFPVANILWIYNTRLRSYVKRNTSLPPCGRDITKFLEVNEDFVFRTPVCTQEGSSIPEIRVDTVIEAGLWERGGDSPLMHILDKLEVGNVVDITLSYGYANGDFTARLPAAGGLSVPYEQGKTCESILDMADKWLAEVDPVRTDAAWHLCLRVYDGKENGKLMADYEDISFRLA